MVSADLLFLNACDRRMLSSHQRDYNGVRALGCDDERTAGRPRNRQAMGCRGCVV